MANTYHIAWYYRCSSTGHYDKAYFAAIQACVGPLRFLHRQVVGSFPHSLKTETTLFSLFLLLLPSLSSPSAHLSSNLVNKKKEQSHRIDTDKRGNISRFVFIYFFVLYIFWIFGIFQFFFLSGKTFLL